jgi:long-chain acyl-CoA synthetase
MHPLLGPFERNALTLSDKQAAGDQSLSLDYQSFRAIACGLAGRIATASDNPRIGILAPTSAAGAVAIFACYYAGRTPVPLNFLLPVERIGRVVADAEIDLVLGVAQFAKTLEALGVRSLMLDAETLTPGSVSAPSVAAGAEAALIYTSGTSGDPKGVSLSFDNLAQNALASVEHMGLDSDHVFLGLLPQFHAFGFTLSTLTPLMLGATAWYLPRFSPVAVVDAVARRGVTVMPAIASMFGAMTKMKRSDLPSLATLKLPISGGEPLPPNVAAAFRERFGVELLEGYGLTETSPVVSCNNPGANLPGSVGRALPGVSVMAVDENGKALPVGVEGELTVAGHCVMRGYRNQPEATAATIRDGVLYTGDIGTIDHDGFIFITGRAKEMIIVGGENVYPREIENVLTTHPGVAEAAVIGRADVLRGESPVAFVVAAEGAELDPMALRGFCREHLAGHKVPREVVVVSDLPRGPTGKVIKSALASPEN